MSELIDIGYRERLSASQSSPNDNCHREKRKLCYLYEILKRISEVPIEIRNQTNSQIDMHLSKGQSLFRGALNQRIKVDLDTQQLLLEFWYRKNSRVISVTTQANRKNIFRPLIKMNSHQTMNILIWPNNGIIYGKNILKFSRKMSLKFIVSEIYIHEWKVMNYFLMVFNLANLIPPDLLKLANQHNRHQLQKVNLYENTTIQNFQRNLHFSNGQIKISKTDVAFSSSKQFPLQDSRQLKPTIDLFAIPTKQICPSTEEITSEEQSILFKSLKMVRKETRPEDFNGLFDECEVISEYIKPTNIKSGMNKILFGKVKLRYRANLLDVDGQIIQTKFSQYYRKIIAIKQPTNVNQRSLKKLSTELQILKKFKQTENPFIPKHFVSRQPQFPHRNRIMLQFLYEYQVLSNYLARNASTAGLSKRMFILVKVIQAVCYIHLHGVSHMDVSFSNIMVFNAHVRLIDFGECYHPSINEEGYLPGYTLPFTPPQRFRKRTLSPKYDVYSFMILLYKNTFESFLYQPATRLPQYLKNDTHLKRTFLCPEAHYFIGFEKLLDQALHLIMRGIDTISQNRPDSTWLVVLMKDLFFFIEDYIDGVALS